MFPLVLLGVVTDRFLAIGGYNRLIGLRNQSLNG
jgi:hypothetical protein